VITETTYGEIDVTNPRPLPLPVLVNLIQVYVLFYKQDQRAIGQDGKPVHKALMRHADCAVAQWYKYHKKAQPATTTTTTTTTT
jgi:hypothetical protein